MIPLTRVVVDNLHMFLRITNVLIDLLIAELTQIEKVQKLHSTDSLTHLNVWKRRWKKWASQGTPSRLDEEVEMESTDWMGKTAPIPENSYPNLVSRAKWSHLNPNTLEQLPLSQHVFISATYWGNASYHKWFSGESQVLCCFLSFCVPDNACNSLYVLYGCPRSTVYDHAWSSCIFHAARPRKVQWSDGETLLSLHFSPGETKAKSYRTSYLNDGQQNDRSVVKWSAVTVKRRVITSGHVPKIVPIVVSSHTVVT